MFSTFKKSVLQIHLILGLSSGLIVFILGITGCLYAFIDEVKSVVYQERLSVEVPEYGTTLPLDVLYQKAQKIVGQGHPITGIDISNQAHRSYQFRTYQKAEAKAWNYFDEVALYRKIYLNPYTGDLLENENTKLEFFNLVLQLHWSLWLTDAIGQPIVGGATLIFVLMLITGLILWYPKNKKAAKQRFWFRWKSTTRWRRKNYDLHNILGFYVQLVALAIAVTGLMWAFDWVEDSVVWALGGKPNKELQLALNQPAPKADLPLENILQDALAKAPDASRFYIAPNKDLAKPTRVFVEFERGAGSRFYYDAASATPLDARLWTDLSTGQKIAALQYDIHVGNILGLPGKILAFFGSLIAASLPITGFLIWRGRRRKKKKKASSRHSTVAIV